MQTEVELEVLYFYYAGNTNKEKMRRSQNRGHVHNTACHAALNTTEQVMVANDDHLLIPFTGLYIKCEVSLAFLLNVVFSFIITPPRQPSIKTRS